MTAKRESGRAYHWGEQLEGELLAAAVKLVEPVGIAALSTREVARLVGVSHAAPTHYYPDRLALAAAVAGHGFERLYQSIHTAIAANTEPPSDALIAASKAYLSFALRSPGLYRTMYAPELSQSLKTSERFREKGKEHFVNLALQRKRVFGLVIGIIADGQKKKAFVDGPPDELARVAMAVCFGIARDYLDGGLMFHGNRESYVRQAVGVILSGLEPR